MKRSAVLLALITAIVAAAYVESRAQAPAPAPESRGSCCGHASVSAEGRLQGVSWMGGGRGEERQPDARRPEPARQEVHAPVADSDDQMRPAQHADAGVRQVRLHRRPLLHDDGRGPRETSHAHARSAGHAAAARDRAHRRFPVGKGRRPGPDGPGQVRRILGQRRRRV